MKFLTFNYTDAKGKESYRQVIQLAPPQPHHFCIDVAELEPVDMFLLQQELEVAEEKAKKDRETILAKYDVSRNFRYFNPQNITNLTEED